MIKVIKFKLSPYRKDRFKKPPKPIKRSRYAEYLWQVGAGWRDE